ncbi:hypothetical protein [Glutamicibacter sp. M10]|uniref:glycosyltransferase family 2 protein n=1 Tax=Glutamicibacter sp. M10 TaxID=3023076 RepID=UPI0029056C84|nr:hypothetical protein [Glutamicibacter sp. M10]
MEKRLAPTIGVVVLTMGNRPVELRRALDSLLSQSDVTIDAVVVGNGWDPTDIPAGIKTHFYRRTWEFLPVGTQE